MVSKIKKDYAWHSVAIQRRDDEDHGRCMKLVNGARARQLPKFVESLRALMAGFSLLHRTVSSVRGLTRCVSAYTTEEKIKVELNLNYG